MHAALNVPPLAARRFVLRMQGFETPFPDVDAALAHLGYVQIDPLNICGRMHDLILRNRVVDYSEGDLMRHVHENAEGQPDAKAAGERTAFEHHHPATNILVVFPLEAWPHLLGAMRTRARQTGAWSGRLTPTEKELAPKLLAEIERRGPLSSEDFDDDRRARRIVWGTSSLVKTTLQKLFFHGRLLIAGRRNNRRLYELPERTLPANVLAEPEAPPTETARWLALLKLRQRRLAALARAELKAVEDAVVPVTVPGCPPLFCLQEDAPVLADECRSDRIESGDDSIRPGEPLPTTDRLQAGPVTEAGVRLLAPLDPVIYDRRVTANLWNFDYTWEAYTPAAKRVRGHYALPVLAGTELVGHVEPKADRQHGRLLVESRSIRRGYSVGPALDELAAWLGLKRGGTRGRT